MAAPTFVKATAGLTDAGGAWTYTVDAPARGGQPDHRPRLQDGVSGVAMHHQRHQLSTNIAGTANVSPTDVWLNDCRQSVPPASTGLFAAARLGTSAIVITGANSGADDIYVRAYEFTNVATGTTLAEHLGAGTGDTLPPNGCTSTTVADVGVTTTAADRLALNFVALADDAMGLAAFAGETGGDWTLATAIYETATGTDATLGLMIAAMPSAGTINGGSDTITSIGWGVIGFALIGAVSVPATSLMLPNRNRILTRR